MQPTTATYRWCTQWFLIADGCLLLLATLAAFLPVTWMQSAHGWLGLGVLEATPIFLYLARSTSMLYAVHGAMLVFIGLNLPSYWRLAEWVSILHIVLGLGLFLTDWTSGMPTYWVALEGIPIAGSGVLLWFLVKRSDFGETTSNEKPV